MNETDGIIVVEPTVLNSVLEVGLCGHFRAMDDDESGNIHHHYDTEWIQIPCRDHVVLVLLLLLPSFILSFEENSTTPIARIRYT